MPITMLANDTSAVTIRVIPRTGTEMPHPTQIGERIPLRTLLNNNTGYVLSEVTLEISSSIEVSKELKPDQFELSSGTLKWLNVPIGAMDLSPNNSVGEDVVLRVTSIQVPVNTKFDINVKKESFHYTVENVPNGKATTEAYITTAPPRGAR